MGFVGSSVKGVADPAISVWTDGMDIFVTGWMLSSVKDTVRREALKGHELVRIASYHRGPKPKGEVRRQVRGSPR